jgi:hypothetical protein
MRTQGVYVLTLMVGLCATPAIGKTVWPQSEPQQVTLFSRIKHMDRDHSYGRSAFNFQHGLRSDDERWKPVTRNEYSILYGSIATNHDSDWFAVSMGCEERSRIKDLGAMTWSNVFDTPFLPAHARTEFGIRFPRRGESYESSSDERVTRVIAGHMYVVHIKKEESDFYAMFRVDSPELSDHCTISWKIVPSPEQ